MNIQEDSVGWDPIYEPHDPGWMVRLYLLFLMFVAIYALVRTITLSVQMFGRAGRHTEDPERLARAAMRNRILSSIGAVPGAVEPYFERLASLVAIRLQSMRRISQVVLLSALPVFLIGSVNTLHGLSVAKAIPMGVLAGSMAGVLIPCLAGLLIGIMLFSIAAIFECILARRRAAFEFLVQTGRYSRAGQ